MCLFEVCAISILGETVTCDACWPYKSNSGFDAAHHRVVGHPFDNFRVIRSCLARARALLSYCSHIICTCSRIVGTFHVHSPTPRAFSRPHALKLTAFDLVLTNISRVRLHSGAPRQATKTFAKLASNWLGLRRSQMRLIGILSATLGQLIGSDRGSCTFGCASKMHGHEALVNLPRKFVNGW